MGKKQVAPAVVWAAIGTTICVASAGLRLGSWRHPQPGLFPFLIGSGIVLLSVVQAISHLARSPSARSP